MANLFLAAARRKVFELLFHAPPRAEKMLAAASQSEKEAAAARPAHVKVDSDSVNWLERIRGEYHSSELGSLSVRWEHGQYRAQFHGLGSALGVEQQTDGSRVVALTSPPWNGGTFFPIGVRLQVAEDGRALVLDGGRTFIGLRGSSEAVARAVDCAVSGL
jgi:hypothetical protein